jgi:uncharacterized SAM-binding protein YcdF (DUF218 family)
VVVVSDAFHLPSAWVIFAVLGHDVRLSIATEGTLAPPLPRACAGACGKPW